MKKVLLILMISISLTGCKSCMADYEQRKIGVRKVCPNCIYTSRNNILDLAIDTSVTPNGIYEVTFCIGGISGYTASDVDHLTKIN